MKILQLGDVRMCVFASQAAQNERITVKMLFSKPFCACLLFYCSPGAQNTHGESRGVLEQENSMRNIFGFVGVRGGTERRSLDCFISFYFTSENCEKWKGAASSATQRVFLTFFSLFSHRRCSLFKFHRDRKLVSGSRTWALCQKRMHCRGCHCITVNAKRVG